MALNYLQEYVKKVKGENKEANSRSYYWSAKNYIDVMKEESFFRDTIIYIQ
jgi:hypothetical protein